jgi:4-amino-4-deoxy-L-arabinose transferase-like glycosyltransferase
VTERSRRFLTGAIFCLAASLLCIDLSSDWRLLHEDNGAVQTTLALSHLEAGLAVTRGHDVFIHRQTGEASPYGHHPPGVALLLAGAFSLAGSAEPVVARSVVILFHLGSLLCVARLLALLFPARAALLGTLAFAILPMSAYFGRMVNYESPCLFGVLLQLLGFAQYSASGRKRSLALLVAGIVLAGLVDWPAFFFAAAIGLTGAWSAFRGDPRGRDVFLVAAGASVATLAFDLIHLWWAGRGALAALSSVAASSAQGGTLLTGAGKFLGGQIDSYRRYFSHTGLLATLFVVLLALATRHPLSRALLGGDSGRERRRVLVASGLAAGAYVLVAPSWASIHPYWKFYFLPFVTVSVALLFEALLFSPRRVARLAGALLLAEMAGTSAYLLHLRHTREGTYAIEATARFRADYLRPEDVMRPRPPR